MSMRETLNTYGISVSGHRNHVSPQDAPSYEGFNHPIQLHLRVFGGEQEEERKSLLLGDYRMLYQTERRNWDWEYFMREFLNTHIDMNLQLLVKGELLHLAQEIGLCDLPFVLTLCALIERDSANSEIEESMDDGLVPATESSIRDLERVVCSDLGFQEQCAICLDTFSVGMELTRMPCSHMYHGDCIVGWLRKSHECPLCRHELPVRQGDA